MISVWGKLREERPGYRQGCNEAKPSATPAIVRIEVLAPSGRQ